MNITRKKNVVFIIMVFVIGIDTVLASPTRLYVDPSIIEDQILSMDDTFTVDINVDDVTDLYAFEFKLRYNDTVLDATEVVQESFLSGSCASPLYESNYVHFACYLTGNVPGKSGNGKLASITLNVLGFGMSDLDLFDTILLDPNANEIAHGVEDGYFANTETTPTTTTSEIGREEVIPEKTTTTLIKTTTTTTSSEEVTEIPTGETVQPTASPLTSLITFVSSNTELIVIIISLFIILFVIHRKLRKRSDFDSFSLYESTN